jgi:hypothetical protein
LQTNPERVWRLVATTAAEAMTVVMHWTLLADDLCRLPGVERSKVVLAAYRALASDGDADTTLAVLTEEVKGMVEVATVQAHLDAVEQALALFHLVRATMTVTWSGTLWKQAAPATLGSRQERFFELRGTTLFYFASAHNGHGVQLRGSIKLGEGATLKRPAPCEVELETLQRTYCLAGATAAEVEALVAALAQACGSCLVVQEAAPGSGDPPASAAFQEQETISGAGEGPSSNPVEAEAAVQLASEDGDGGGGAHVRLAATTAVRMRRRGSSKQQAGGGGRGGGRGLGWRCVTYGCRTQEVASSAVAAPNLVGGKPQPALADASRRPASTGCPCSLM